LKIEKEGLMVSLKGLFKAFLLSFFVACASPAWAQDHVVYHIDDAAFQGLKALRNVRNHLDVAPKTKIVVVTHADGVDLLFEGARDPKSNTEYAPLISALKGDGVSFEVCEITMKRRNLNKDQFVMDADFVPSGVVRLTELQTREHYAYIKP
jgi:intracellular sulfur oxidation DsrE/DsrF family protein